MDANVTRAIEQGKRELSNGKAADDRNVRAAITAIAGYLNNSSLSTSHKSALQLLKQQLEQLKD